jgi:hypothetical protein
MGVLRSLILYVSFRVAPVIYSLNDLKLSHQFNDLTHLEPITILQASYTFYIVVLFSCLTSILIFSKKRCELFAGCMISSIVSYIFMHMSFYVLFQKSIFETEYDTNWMMVRIFIARMCVIIDTE